MAFDNLLPRPTAGMSAGALAYMDKALAMSESAASASRHHLDLAYGDDYWQKVDIYLPDREGLQGLPVLMFLHGGGWTHGYKEWMGFMAPPLVSLPSIFVSVSYRLAPEHRFPAPLYDTFAAVRWAWENIARYGGDPNRIFIGGHSAGGHLSSLATLRRDLAADHGLPPNAIKACFPCSTTFRFTVGQLEEMGKEFLERPEDAHVASPLTYVAGNTTPFYVSYGSADFDRVLRTSAEMISALERERSVVESLMLNDMDHFHTNLVMGDPKSTWVRKVREWMSDEAPLSLS